MLDRLGLLSRARCVLSDVAVLDGRTLTGRGSVSDLRTGAGALVLARGDARRTAAVTMDGDGTFTFAVALDPPDGLDLRRGTWRVALGREALGAVRPIRTTGTTLATDRPSPTLENPRSPGTGRRYQPGVDTQGTVTIAVARYPTHAEVERVAVDGGRVSVHGRIVGSATLVRRAQAGAPATIVVKRRGHKQRLSFPAALAAGGFTADIPLDRLRFGAAGEWVLQLRIGQAEPLAVRRALTDLRDLAGVHRYPVARVRRRGRITTTYAGNGDLLLVGERAAVAPAS